VPVRTAYDPTAGEVLTAANLERFPGGWIGSVESTSDAGGISTTVTDITGATVTVTVNSSRRLRITGIVHTSDTIAGNNVTLSIREGSTTLASTRKVVSTASGVSPQIVETEVTPTSGSHTYKLSMLVDGGFGNYHGTVSPTRLRVDDIGPAS